MLFYKLFNWSNLSHQSLTFWWLWIYLELHIMYVTCHLYQLIWIFCLMCCLKCSSASEWTQSVTDSKGFVFMHFEDVCGKFHAALLTDKKELRYSIFRCYPWNAVIPFLHYFTELIFKKFVVLVLLASILDLIRLGHQFYRIIVTHGICKYRLKWWDIWLILIWSLGKRAWNAWKCTVILARAVYFSQFCVKISRCNTPGISMSSLCIAWKKHLH